MTPETIAYKLEEARYCLGEFSGYSEEKLSTLRDCIAELLGAVELMAEKLGCLK